MKKLGIILLIIPCFLTITINLPGQGNPHFANRDLSNLTTPTAVNTHLLPKFNNNFNLGSSLFKWKYIYVNNIIGSTASFSGTGSFRDIETRDLKITGGTPAAGRVLTSDANGVATWQLPVTPVSAWSLNGNSGTVDGTNFIGTTDDVPLTFKVNGVVAGRIDDYYLNTIWGYHAGPAEPSNLGGYLNTAIGYEALPNSDRGCCNTATGVRAMIGGASGQYNTANGMESEGGTDQNTTMGYQAMAGSQGGSCNTAIGTMADIVNNGSFNTGVGFQTLYSGTGEGLTAIGYGADVIGDNIRYSTAVGSGAFVWESNQANIGGPYALSVGAFVNWSNFSDGRYKKNVKQNVPGLEFINALNPITYTLDVNAVEAKFNSSRKTIQGRDGKMLSKPIADQESVKAKSQVVYTGFSAQEVEAAAKKIKYDFSGIDKPGNGEQSFYSLRYGDFVVPLVKAVQELSAKNDSLEAANAQMNERLGKIEQYLGMNNPSKNSSAVLLGSAKLYQNIPNPFNQNTSISYYIPEGSGSARITITDMNGMIVKSIELPSRGNGQLTLETPQLLSGVYTYNLVINGNITDTKKMILTKQIQRNCNDNLNYLCQRNVYHNCESWVNLPN